MAKKVRRVRRTATSGRQTATNQERSPSPAPNVTPAVEELREEYAYVLRDLRRMFLLAVVMFLLLIGLNILL